MTNQSTIDKLIEMRLTTMADAFRVNVNEKVYHPLTKKFTTPLAN